VFNLHKIGKYNKEIGEKSGNVLTLYPLLQTSYYTIYVISTCTARGLKTFRLFVIFTL